MKTDKVSAIYNATIELMTTKGFQATSMANIIKEAGVGAGTLYHHFESKEVLINQLIIKIKTELSQAIMKNFDTSASIEKNFEMMWEATWDYTFKYQQKAYFAEMFIGSTLISAKSLEEMYALFAESMSFLDDAMQKGVIESMPLEILESTIFGPIYHMLKLCRSGVVEEPMSHKNEMFTLCWKALQR